MMGIPPMPWGAQAVLVRPFVATKVQQKTAV